MGDTTDGAHGDGLAPRRLIPLEERLGQVRYSGHTPDYCSAVLLGVAAMPLSFWFQGNVGLSGSLSGRLVSLGAAPRDAAPDPGDGEAQVRVTVGDLAWAARELYRLAQESTGTPMAEHYLGQARRMTNFLVYLPGKYARYHLGRNVAYFASHKQTEPEESQPVKTKRTGKAGAKRLWRKNPLKLTGDPAHVRRFYALMGEIELADVFRAAWRATGVEGPPERLERALDELCDAVGIDEDWKYLSALYYGIYNYAWDGGLLDTPQVGDALSDEERASRLMEVERLGYVEPIAFVWRQGEQLRPRR